VRGPGTAHYMKWKLRIIGVRLREVLCMCECQEVPSTSNSDAGTSETSAKKTEKIKLGAPNESLESFTK
jgi:hypothetical protein